MTQCECRFPTFELWRRTDDALRDESYEQQHQAYHDRWKDRA